MPVPLKHAATLHAVISVGFVDTSSQWEYGKSTQLRARVRFLPLLTHIAHRRDDLKQSNHARMGELTQDLHFPYRCNRELAQLQCVQEQTHTSQSTTMLKRSTRLRRSII